MADFEAEGLTPEETREEIAAELDYCRDDKGRLINTPESCEILGEFIADVINDEYSKSPEADAW